MRFPLVSATMVACLLSVLVLVTQLSGQGVPTGGPVRTATGPGPAAAAPVGSNVVVIDIAHIFKNHNRFNATMLDIKNDIEQFEAYVRKKQTDFKTQTETLATYKAGSQEYRQKEEELARTQSDLQVEVGLKRKEFLQQEARVYFRVYKEIEQEVGIFAQRNRIDLVLRYSRDEMKEDDRASVLQGVNRPVVYQSGRDITEAILGKLNAGAPGPAAPQTGATNPQLSRPPASPVIPGRPMQR